MLGPSVKDMVAGSNGTIWAIKEPVEYEMDTTYEDWQNVLKISIAISILMFVIACVFALLMCGTQAMIRNFNRFVRARSWRERWYLFRGCLMWLCCRGPCRRFIQWHRRRRVVGVDPITIEYNTAPYRRELIARDRDLFGIDAIASIRMPPRLPSPNPTTTTPGEEARSASASAPSKTSPDGQLKTKTRSTRSGKSLWSKTAFRLRKSAGSTHRSPTGERKTHPESETRRPSSPGEPKPQSKSRPGSAIAQDEAQARSEPVAQQRMKQRSASCSPVARQNPQPESATGKPIKLEDIDIGDE